MKFSFYHHALLLNAACDFIRSMLLLVVVTKQDVLPYVQLRWKR